MKLDIYKTDGKTSGEQATLPKEIFEIEPNDHAIWVVVTAEQGNRRQGTASTKNKALVRGGGRKPWRQKGRGTARAGSIRSPLWVGGGRIFGPEPRSYNKRIPKKIKLLARKSALSYKAKEKRIRLVEDFSFDSPKTKGMADILKNFELQKKRVLLLTANTNQTIWLSGRNIPSFVVREAITFSTEDVVKADTLLIQKGALKKINEVLGK